MKITHIKADDTSITASSDTTMDLSLTKLMVFSKSTRLSETVILYLNEEIPFSLNYIIPEVGYIRYYLSSLIKPDSNSGQQNNE